jgi:ribosomal-protein-alanine N-acetyltransferase
VFDAVDTARLHLRAVDEGDASRFCELMTPAVVRWLASWPSPVTEAFALERIRRAHEAMRKGHAVCLGIERREDRAFMGSVMIFRSDTDPGLGGLGYWLGEPYQRQGFMTEASAAAVSLAFDRLNLSRIEAGAQPENQGSFAIMRALGMQPAGSRLMWASGRGREERCEYFQVTRAAFEARRMEGA